MLPSSFEYHRPATLDEALSLLATHGDDAKVLAGGQSLIPIMKLRFASPGQLIDINRIEGLDGIEETRREPADRSARPAQPPRRERHHQRPLPDDRGRGAADRGPAGPQPRDDRRFADARGSVRRPRLGDARAGRERRPEELDRRARGADRRLPGRHVPELDRARTRSSPRSACRRPAHEAGGAYLKLERKVGDYATVAAAIYLELNNGSIGKAGIALTSVGLTNIKATAAEASLVGAAPGDGVFADAGRLAAEATNPVADVRGSAPSTRSTWSRCTCDAAWPARSRWPARPEPRGDAHMEVKINVNGTERAADVEPRQLLVHVIREEFELTGTHVGCDTTSCGACTVLLDGVPIKSCTMFGVQADGRSVTTVEGLAGRRRAAPDPGGVQGGARPAVRVLHAGHDAHRRRAHRDRTRLRATTTSGGRSRARSAGAPAT